MTMNEKYPFQLVACCLLPEHLHCIWTLPEHDADYSIRWQGIKGLFSREYKKKMNLETEITDSLKKKREAGIWQRRFWEHTLVTQEDYNTHVDYIHYNPVKHGLVKHVRDWPWSSFHRYVKEGVYGVEWGTGLSDRFGMVKEFGE